MSASQAKLEEALAFHQNGQLMQAKVVCESIITAEPNQADALHLLAVIAYQTNNPQLAIELIDRAIKVNSINPIFYSTRGKALQVLNRVEEAIENYDYAIRIKPDFAIAYFNRGNALQKLMRFEDAVASYDHAIAIKPSYTERWPHFFEQYISVYK